MDEPHIASKLPSVIELEPGVALVVPVRAL